MTAKALKSDMPSATPAHRDLANAIRALSMDAVEAANSGHPGMPMGMADVATVLFTRYLKFDPAHPQWPDRDRFVLSAGHGSMLLYSLLYLTGYADITLDEIKRFRQLGAKTAGHPEYGHAAGIETTTGPLGQGLANSVGMALGERMLNARFGNGLVDHHTYVIAGDGCLMEGISQEAISLAGHLRLNKLIVFWDDNRISIDGPTDLSTSENQKLRFEACGWNVLEIDGHDPDAIAAAIEKAQKSDKPTMIACRTTIAYGAPTKAGTSGSHGSPLGKEEIAGTRKQLGWKHPPFEIPDNIRNAWRKAGARGAADYNSWNERLDNDAMQRNQFTRTVTGELPDGWNKKLEALKKEWADAAPRQATRQSSGKVLEVLNNAIPELIGGSADLTGSVNTKTSGLEPLTKENYGGRYIYYGIREHGMAAAMNGLALHGGVIPYAGTFMVFTDYCKPAIRLSALMGQRVIYVMTHDSIGLGEDGPTHQPIEHLAALRAVPNLNVFRPADAVETAECWALAIADKHTPSVLSLTRQGVPALRTTHTDVNLCAKGGYIVSESDGDAKAVLLATGSEVSIAVEAQGILKKKGIAVQVVSLPCIELFLKQPESYRAQVLPSGLPRVAVEAAARMGWDRLLGEKDIFIGMDGFGASAPAPDLYKHFGITAEKVVEAVEKRF